MAKRRTAARAALNAVLGAYLERQDNPLAIAMAFYREGAPLELSGARLGALQPPLGSRIVVFVHGMAQTEACWEFPGGAGQSYGSLLERALGVTPLYLRYNSGRHVAQNGRELSALLEALVTNSPAPVEDITLVGHSLGGLLVRSACHQAESEGHTWRSRARRAVYLGTPHLGTPLEKAGHLVSRVLGQIDDPVVQLLHDLAELRGPAVKALGWGSLLDEGSQLMAETARRELVPLTPGIEHYFVAGTLSKDERHVAAWLFGDALVRVSSASGASLSAGLAPGHSAILAGTGHMELAHSPAVFEHLWRWLRDARSGDALAASVPSEHVVGELSAASGEPAPVSRAQTLAELEGYRALAEAAVEHGVSAVQRIQEQLSARPYDLLNAVPVARGPAEAVRSLHESSVKTTYSTIRAVNRGLGKLLAESLRWFDEGK